MVRGTGLRLRTTAGTTTTVLRTRSRTPAAEHADTRVSQPAIIPRRPCCWLRYASRYHIQSSRRFAGLRHTHRVSEAPSRAAARELRRTEVLEQNCGAFVQQRRVVSERLARLQHLNATSYSPNLLGEYIRDQRLDRETTTERERERERAAPPSIDRRCCSGGNFGSAHSVPSSTVSPSPRPQYLTTR